MSFADAFLSLGVFPLFTDNFNLENIYIDMQLFSAPVSNKAFISLSCILIGKVVLVFLPNIMLKTCSKSQQMHSTKYTSGLYLHSSHLSMASPSEVSMSSSRSSTSSSGNCMSCISLTFSLDISCPVMAEMP